MTSSPPKNKYANKRQLSTIVEPNIKDKFIGLAKKQGSTPSGLLRNLIYDYVNEH